MKIILTDGTELHPILVTGGSKYILGSSRDTLTFIFPEDPSLEEIDTLFTSENCKSIKMYQDNNEYIHKGYVVRTELKRSPVIVIHEETFVNEEGYEKTKTEEIIENRVFVSMSVQTPTEKQIDNVQDVMNALLGIDE